MINNNLSLLINNNLLHPNMTKNGNLTDIPKTQKAVVYDGHGKPLQLRDIPVPELGVDDILVKIIYSGVCRTDVHAWEGDFPVPIKKAPIVGGHEGAGVVVKLGANVSGWKIGDGAGVKVSSGEGDQDEHLNHDNLLLYPITSVLPSYCCCIPRPT